MIKDNKKKSPAKKGPAKKGPGGAAGKAKAALQAKKPGGGKKNQPKIKGSIGKKAKKGGMAMDVEMGGAGSARKKGAKKKGVAGKIADTLKARISAAVARRGGTVNGKSKGKATTPTKASDIKITIKGGAGGGGFAFKPTKGSRGGSSAGKGGNGGRGGGGARGLGGSLKAMMGRAKSAGGILKPGQQQQSRKSPGGGLAGIGKKKAAKARTVVVGAGKSVAKAIGGRGGGRGKGRGGGGRAGKSFAQRFGGRR